MSINHINNNSLLKYLQDDDGRGSTMESLSVSTSLPDGTGAANISSLEQLKKLLAQETGSSTETDKTYTLLKSSAQSVRASAEKLQQSGSGSLFAKAEESGDKTELLKGIQEFVKNYNSMMSDLKNCPDLKSAVQREKMANMAAEKAKQFEKAGITVNEDGTLTVNKEALEKAELSDLKKLFNGPSSFLARVKASSVYVESNATSNERIAATDTYGKSGKYSNYLSGLSGSHYNRTN